MTVGSPQQVIDRTLSFREYVGDYQRQLFLIDHAGLPLAEVLKQLDMFAEEVLPVLRRETETRKAPGTPERMPTVWLRALKSRLRARRRSTTSREEVSMTISRTTPRWHMQTSS